MGCGGEGEEGAEVRARFYGGVRRDKNCKNNSNQIKIASANQAGRRPSLSPNVFPLFRPCVKSNKSSS